MKTVMIGALSGNVLIIKSDHVVLMVNGCGYKVFLPSKTALNIHRNDSLLIYIHTYVREDALNLYGFSNQEELDLFELLLGVSGIGPKTALNIVDHTVRDVYKAIMEADVHFFTAIPRLGSKNAQKIIIELKTKIGSNKDLDLTGDERLKMQEIVDALLAMGFTRPEAVKAIREIPSHATTLGEKIKFSIQLLGK